MMLKAGTSSSPKSSSPDPEPLTPSTPRNWNAQSTIPLKAWAESCTGPLLGPPPPLWDDLAPQRELSEPPVGPPTPALSPAQSLTAAL